MICAALIDRVEDAGCVRFLQTYQHLPLCIAAESRNSQSGVAEEALSCGEKIVNTRQQLLLITSSPRSGWKVCEDFVVRK